MDRFIDKLIEMLTLDKPVAATSKVWREWEQDARLNKPLAYFINETIPDWAGNVWSVLSKPFKETKWWIRYRLFDRYHVIPTGLEPGYRDADVRILYGMFNLLVDFVEIEKAWMHVAFDEEELKKRKHPWWSFGWTRFKSFRDPDAGLAHLAWETTLDDPCLDEYNRSDNQAATAREIQILYDWWKNIRPARPDPYDASGWSDYCSRKRDDNIDLLDFESRSESDRNESGQILDECHRIEKSYDDEDQEMLIRLIKIRKGLWT